MSSSPATQRNLSLHYHFDKLITTYYNKNGVCVAADLFGGHTYSILCRVNVALSASGVVA